MWREELVAGDRQRSTGAEWFEAIYETGTEAEAEWLRRGAVSKVDSIEELLERVGFTPDTVLDLGAGTGATIEECIRRGTGKEFFAVDYCPDAVRYLQQRCTGRVSAAVCDITKQIPFVGSCFDVAILSHVLEHLERPDLVLRNVRGHCKYLIAEVPLEDLPVRRLKSFLAQVIFRKDRRQNQAGHVQLFTKKALRHLLEAAGWQVIADRTYVPADKDLVVFMCRKNEYSPLKTRLALLLNYYLSRLLRTRLWSSTYCAHYAVIVVAR